MGDRFCFEGESIALLKKLMCSSFTLQLRMSRPWKELDCCCTCLKLLLRMSLEGILSSGWVSYISSRICSLSILLTSASFPSLIANAATSNGLYFSLLILCVFIAAISENVDIQMFRSKSDLQKKVSFRCLSSRTKQNTKISSLWGVLSSLLTALISAQKYFLAELRLV